MDNNKPNFTHTLEQVDSNETKLCEVAKHPFGVFIVYLQAAAGFVLSVGLTYFLLPSVMEDTNKALLYANMFTLVALVLTIVAVVLISFIYRQNRLTVTDRNITQKLQYGLFSRKVSQLNMVNVEDVTAVQNGIFQTLFGFGDLKIETAGEQVNFHFTYCPRPGYYAKVILDAREEILGQNDGDARVETVETTTG